MIPAALTRFRRANKKWAEAHLFATATKAFEV
jgi:hypothetical protein